MINQTVLQINFLGYLNTEFQNPLKQLLKQPMGHNHKIKND